jgi:transposase
VSTGERPGGGAGLPAARWGEPVRAAIGSMNGARSVHGTLELHGWDVEIRDAKKVKGPAPLACKTDRVHAWVLAELTRRDLVPAIRIPTPGVRAERERARSRRHLVRHRTALKDRIHAALIALGRPCPVSDPFGQAGRELLSRPEPPEPWAGTVRASPELIEDLDARIASCGRELRRLGADHPYVPHDRARDRVGPRLRDRLGDIGRSPSPKKLTGHTGLCPRVHRSGGKDHRGPLSKDGPRYPRWALIEAATHAARHPRLRDHHERTERRLGRQRGSKVARVEVARKLAEAIRFMLTRDEDFAPAGPTRAALVA